MLTLAMTFKLDSGDTRTMSTSYPKEELSEGEVEACMDEIIAAGDIWTDPPVEALKATLTEKTVTVLLQNS